MKFVLALAENISFSYYRKSVVLFFISIWSIVQSEWPSLFPKRPNYIILQEMESPQHFFIIVSSSSITISIWALFAILGKNFKCYAWLPFPSISEAATIFVFSFHHLFSTYYLLLCSYLLSLYILQVDPIPPREESMGYLVYKPYVEHLNKIKYLI